MFNCRSVEYFIQGTIDGNVQWLAMFNRVMSNAWSSIGRVLEQSMVRSCSLYFEHRDYLCESLMIFFGVGDSLFLNTNQRDTNFITAAFVAVAKFMHVNSNLQCSIVDQSSTLFDAPSMDARSMLRVITYNVLLLTVNLSSTRFDAQSMVRGCDHQILMFHCWSVERPYGPLYQQEHDISIYLLSLS